MSIKEHIIEELKKTNPYQVARVIYGPRPTKAQEQYVYQVANIEKLKNNQIHGGN